MNKIIMVGRLVKDVECRNVGTNGKVTNNVIAINRYHKNNNGERQADFIPIVAWNHLADLMKKYSKKGDQISISGRMQSRKYINKEAQEVYVLECIVDDITFIYQGNKNKIQNQGQSQEQSQGQNQSQSQDQNQGQSQGQEQGIQKEEVPVTDSRDALP